MNDATQGRHRCADRIEHRGQLVGLSDVAAGVDHVAALAPQVLDGLLPGLRCRAASEQHQMLGAAIDHPRGGGETDAAEPTGDQIGGFRVELRRELFIMNGRLLPALY